MRLHREETFGPVLAAYRFSTDDEAVALCNDSIYGLHASVYARNIRRAQGLAVRIHTGTVSINENHKAIWATMNATQGGFKLSGAGRRHGHEGIAQYTQAQQVTTQHVVPLVPGGWLPPKRWDQFFALVIKLMGRIPGLR